MEGNKFIGFVVRVFIVVVLVVLGLMSLYYSFNLTYPFLIAFALAFIINPLVNLLEKKGKLPRSLSVLLSILFLFGVVGGVITLIIIKIIDGFDYFSQKLPNYIEMFFLQLQSFFINSILPFWETVLGLFNELDESQRNTIQENTQQIGLQFGTILGRFGETVANILSQFVGALPITLTALVFIIIALFFISKDWYKLGKLARKRIPIAFYEIRSVIITDLKSKLIGYLVAQLILISMTATITFIGLLILRVEQPFTIALIAGMVDIIPYLGTGIIFVPWLIYGFITGNYFLGIGLIVLYLVTIIQRQLAEPKVLSSKLGLNPLAMLISLFVGIQLFGFIGLMIGPVLLVILVSLYHAGIFGNIWIFIKSEKT